MTRICWSNRKGLDFFPWTDKHFHILLGVRLLNQGPDFLVLVSFNVSSLTQTPDGWPEAHPSWLVCMFRIQIYFCWCIGHYFWFSPPMPLWAANHHNVLFTWVIVLQCPWLNWLLLPCGWALLKTFFFAIILSITPWVSWILLTWRFPIFGKRILIVAELGWDLQTYPRKSLALSHFLIVGKLSVCCCWIKLMLL